MKQSVIVALCFCVVSLLAPAQTTDISWNFNSFLGMTGGNGQEPWVISFQARGKNNTKQPISRIGGYVKSDTSDQRFPIWLIVGGQLVPSDEKNKIQPGAGFDVATKPFNSSPTNREGMPATKFLSNFSSFTFVFEHDGKSTSRHFVSSEVAKRIQDFQRESEPIVRR